MASGKNKALLRFSNCMILHKEKYWTWFWAQEFANGETSSFSFGHQKGTGLNVSGTTPGSVQPVKVGIIDDTPPPKEAWKREIVLRIPVPPTHPSLFMNSSWNLCLQESSRENQERKWAQKGPSPCLTLRLDSCGLRNLLLFIAGEVKLYVSGEKKL